MSNVGFDFHLHKTSSDRLPGGDEADLRILQRRFENFTEEI